MIFRRAALWFSLLVFGRDARRDLLRGESYIIKSFFLSVWPKAWVKQYLEDESSVDLEALKTDLATKKRPFPDGKYFSIIRNHVERFKLERQNSVLRSTYGKELPERLVVDEMDESDESEDDGISLKDGGVKKIKKPFLHDPARAYSKEEMSHVLREHFDFDTNSLDEGEGPLSADEIDALLVGVDVLKR